MPSPLVGEGGRRPDEGFSPHARDRQSPVHSVSLNQSIVVFINASKAVMSPEKMLKVWSAPSMIVLRLFSLPAAATTSSATAGGTSVSLEPAMASSAPL